MSSSEEQAVDLLEVLGLADDIFEDATERKTANTVASLMKHLNGFEYWPMLIDDCKEVVAKFLDPTTLTRLGTCSRVDHAVVERIPIHVRSIGISEKETDPFQNFQENFENVDVNICFGEDNDSLREIQMVFSQLGENTQVEWEMRSRKGPERRRETIEKSSYREEAVKYAEKWMERCHFKMDGFSVGLSTHPPEISKIKYLPNCTRLSVSTDEVSSFRFWLEKVPENLDNVFLGTLREDSSSLQFPSELLSVLQIKNAKRLYLGIPAEFNEEQFLALNATHTDLDFGIVTDSVINSFLINWANGKAANNFTKLVTCWREVPDQSVVLNGLEVRPWTGDLEDELGWYCQEYARFHGHGETFQVSGRVRDFESVTVCFGEYSLTIVATGKRAERDGEWFTDYIIPY